ncbi:monocarboxylate transporter 12-like [Babylonia areolata]|uniref:monocarboxylate transporter 12-like n=1 Tax=Babylonia areolata TaxID=304850 RepID=UPI003FCF6716
MSSLEKDANHLQPPHTTPPPPPPPPSQPHTPPDELASSSQQVVAHGQAHMDGGWAWVVMVASFLISAVVDGVGFSVGVLLSSLQKEFDANNQQVSWVSSVLNGTYLLIGPVVSFFINRHGCRKVSLLGCVIAAASFILSTLCPTIELVILVYGLVGGIGLGCLYQPSVVIVGQYFYARRALALGFTACGSGIGAFAFAPLFGLFVQHYSWKGATILAAALVLLCGLACATFKPIHVPEGCIWMGVISAKSSLVTIPSKLYEGVGMGPLTETITARGGMVVEPEHESCDEISATAVSAFGSKSMYVPTTFLPPVAELLRFSASQGAFLVSTIGIGNVVGRLLTGLIAHYHPRLVLALNYGSLILAGLVTCLLPLLYKYHLMLGYSLLFGSCIGMFVVLQLMVLIQLMGFDHLNLAFGVISMYHGIGTFVGPPLAGFVADTTGNLRNAFYAIGAAFTLAGIICLPLQQISITECRNVKASPASTELRKHEVTLDQTDRPV